MTYKQNRYSPILPWSREKVYLSNLLLSIKLKEMLSSRYPASNINTRDSAIILHCFLQKKFKIKRILPQCLLSQLLKFRFIYDYIICHIILNDPCKMIFINLIAYIITDFKSTINAYHLFLMEQNSCIIAAFSSSQIIFVFNFRQ